jgi:1,4-dihydroxy-2-naphthoyl-CoA hydrolase
VGRWPPWAYHPVTFGGMKETGVTESDTLPADNSARDAMADSMQGTLPERMGISLLEVAPERVVGTMPVAGNTQPYGLLHGGASVVLAETLGSIGAALHAARLFNGIAVGIEVNATHHKAARAGIVTGVATPLRLGGMIASYEIAITDESGERVCTARLTCALRRTPAVS